MSTNHTPHFNLSQWEPGDQVVRTEFNENHAKIEHVLLNHRSGELILEKTVEEETAWLYLDISQVDWSRYMALALTLDSSENNGFQIIVETAVERCVYIYQHAAYPAVTSGIGFAYQVSHMFLLIPVFYDGSHSPLAIGFASGDSHPSLCGGGAQNRLDQCQRLSIRRTSGSFVPGDRAVLWGIK